MNTVARPMTSVAETDTPVKRPFATPQGSLMQHMNRLLAEAIALQLRIEQAQLANENSTRLGLPDILGKVHGAIKLYVDLLVARISALGGLAELPPLLEAAHSRNSAFPIGIAGQLAHFGFVSAELRAFRQQTKAVFKVTTEVGDYETANIVSDISLGIDNWLWFVGSDYQFAE